MSSGLGILSLYELFDTYLKLRRIAKYRNYEKDILCEVTPRLIEIN